MDDITFNDQEEAELVVMMMGLERCYRDGNISGIKDVLGNIVLMCANAYARCEATKESLACLKIYTDIRQKMPKRRLMRLTRNFLNKIEESMSIHFTEAYGL